MEIVININDPDPLFSQIVDQVKQAVLNGDLQAGDALPSIRQLANDLELNHNTVAKAYRVLERDTVIETKGYRGTFIHADAMVNSTVDLNPWILSRLGEVIRELRGGGVTDSEIRNAFRSVMNERNN